MLNSIVSDILENEEKIEPIHEGGSTIRISVVGIGGAGCNSVSRITKSGIRSAHTIAVNTDKLHLNITEAHSKHVLGYSVTKGLGAGGYPDVARKAAEIDKKELAKLIGENEIVFLLAGMGGGTGTGASPVIAQVAKDQGAVVISIVTYPFALERARLKKAQEGINELMKVSDTVIVIDNNRLTSYAPNLPINEAFRIADEIALRAVRGISDTIVESSLINIDYADVKSLMGDGGLAMISLGEAKGIDMVENVVEDTLNHPLLDVEYEGAKGAIIHIEGGRNLSLGDAISIGEGISKSFDDNAQVKLGARFVPEMNESVRVTSIITGVKSPSLFSSLGQAEEPKSFYDEETEEILKNL